MFKDSISDRSYPELPEVGAVSGARPTHIELVGNQVVFLIEKGEASRRWILNQQTVALGRLDLDTKKLQFIEIEHAEMEREREFQHLEVINPDLIEFATIWRDKRNTDDAERKPLNYRRNLRTDEITKAKPLYVEHDEKCPLIPGFFLKRIHDTGRTTLLTVTEETSGKSYPLRTYYPIQFDGTSTLSRWGRHYGPSTFLSAGDEKTPLLMINYSNNEEITSKALGYNLHSKQRTDLISGDDIEKELGRTDCRGLQPVGNLRYPLSRLPLLVDFKTGPSVCAIVKNGQLEWVVQLGEEHKWITALASDNERFLGIITYSAHFDRHLFLADCEQRTIAPPLDFEYPRLQKYRRYDLNGVTNDGRLILSDRDIVLARYKDRWELEPIQVLKPPQKEDSKDE